MYTIYVYYITAYHHTCTHAHAHTQSDWQNTQYKSCIYQFQSKFTTSNY
jgi:hypothetical protein